ncbi:MAG: class I SAM-dependent methyltransferase, partial [Chloroflexi bacterium]|nr:class I SAM-dependent methyltransferase [Chloroflexota bacterium]
NTPHDSTIFTLDLPPGNSSSPCLTTTAVDDTHIAYRAHTKGYLYLTDPSGCKVKQLYGDSAQFDFGPYRESVDLFFVDGAHSYEYVRSDTAKALSCTRKDGVILWHDYGCGS